MVAGPRSTDGNLAGPIDAPHAADGAEQRGTPVSPETPRTRVDEFVRESHAPPGPPNGNGAGRLLAMVKRWFGLAPQLAIDQSIGDESWTALSDVVAFFETVKTHNLATIRGRYEEIVTNGFDGNMIYDLLMDRFRVAPARLELDIGHQNPNPNRSITELTSNAVDAMKGMNGDVSVAIENGRYTVSDSGIGMSAHEIFEKLLIPQLSGKSGKDTIGRFGIGFYTAFVHLKHPNSRVILESKSEGNRAMRIEFIRLNDQLGVRVEPSTRMDRGTAVLVRDAGIDPERMGQELFKNMSYVMGRAIMVNGQRINNIDPAHVSGVGSGTMYVSEEKNREGKVVITMGGGTLEEFAVSGYNVPELVVFDFPFDIEFPESRNRLRVDSGVVNQVRAFIDAVEGIDGYTNKIAYLNAIAPMIVELQKRNERSERASDLAEYAKFVARKYLHGKTLIPDDPFYNIMVQKGFIRVNELYLGRDWQARFDEPPEWRGSTKILLTDFIPVAATGIMYDRERNIVLLSRSLYEMHRNDPAGLRVLLDLAKAQGSWGTSQPRETTASASFTGPSQSAGGEIEASSTEVSSDIKNLLNRHYIFARFLPTLREIEKENPGALNLLARLDTVYIPHAAIRETPESGDDAGQYVGGVFHAGGTRLFDLTVRSGSDRISYLLRADGTPLIDEALNEIRLAGKENQYFLIRLKGGGWRLLNLDGTPAIEGIFPGLDIIYGTEWPDLLAIQGEGGWRIFNFDMTPAVDVVTDHVQVKYYPNGETYLWANDVSRGPLFFKWVGNRFVPSEPVEMTATANNDFPFVDYYSWHETREGRFNWHNPWTQIAKVAGETRRNPKGKPNLNDVYLVLPGGMSRGLYYTVLDHETSQVLSTLDPSVLFSPIARQNLEHLLNLGVDSKVQATALALLKFPANLFEFALRLLPYTKMDMRFAERLVGLLEPLAQRYSLETVAALCDIALSVGWGDVPPAYALTKLQTLADRISPDNLQSLRDVLSGSFLMRMALKSQRLDSLVSLPPKMRAYAYYLAMDAAELLPEGSSQIPVVSGSATFSLVDLNTAVRSHSDGWLEFHGNTRQAARTIRRQTEGADPELSANRIRHAMYYLSDGLNLLYLRGLIQNSLDAIHNNDEAGGTINVESFEDNGAHVLRIADPGGMSFSDALNNLFVFGESTTERFGVGFFTIYPGAAEVRIKTGTGDGKVSIFTLRPVYKGEEVIDVTISYVVKNENFKGTIIERTSSGEIPALDAAFDRSSTLSYGRFLSEIGVTYNGRQVNLAMRPIADYDVPTIGRVRIYEASENAITRGGLYVKDIPSMFYKDFPPALRAVLAPRGIVIDLPGSIPTVRSGNEFLNPANLEWRLMPWVNAMLLQSYLLRFARGLVDITGIPDVYFNSMYGFANEQTIEPEIRDDAERLMRGEGLPEIGRYQDERNFLKLLTLLPCLGVDGEIISIYGLLESFEKGERIDTSKLPYAITSRLEIAMRSREALGSNREMMDGIAQELGITGHGRELALEDWKQDELHRHWTRTDAVSNDANSYDAFLSIVSELMTFAGNSHHTIGFSSFLERNALADHTMFAGRIEMYFSITAAEKYARELFEILSAEEYPAGRMQALMAELIDKVTHEMTHDLSEQPNEWTHDNEFYEEQQIIVSKLLRYGPLELEKLWRFLKVVYPNPTFMPAAEFLKILITRRRENPSGATPAASPAATPTPAPQAPPAPAAPADESSSSAPFEQPTVTGLADTGEISGGQYVGYSDYGIEATARSTQRSAAQVHAQRHIATQRVQPAQVRTPIAAPVRPSIGVAP